MSDPDRFDGVFDEFVKKIPLRKMGKFAEKRGDFSAFEGGAEFGGMSQIGGVDVAIAFMLQNETIALETGIGISPLEVTGEVGEMLGGERGELEGSVGETASGLDGMPLDGKANEFGKEKAFFQPVFHIFEHIGGAEDVKGRATGAQPEGLDEHGKLADVIAVHVADPDRFGDVGIDFLMQEEAGDGCAAVEEDARFLSENQDAGVFPTRTGMSVGSTEKNGAHGNDVARFLDGRQSKMVGV